MNFQAFLDSLNIMWKGMLGIFIVIGIIVVCIYVLFKLFPYKEEKQDKTE